MTEPDNSVTEMESHLQASIDYGSENTQSIATEVSKICQTRDMMEDSDVSQEDIRKIIQDLRGTLLKPLVTPLARHLSNQFFDDGGLSYRPGHTVFVSLVGAISGVLVHDSITNESFALLGLVVLLVCFSAYLATEFEITMEIN